MSLTTDRNDPGLKVIKSDGQQESYLVLSEEERSKGFVRPYRDTYVHVGGSLKGLLKDKVKILDEEEKNLHGDNYYAYAEYDPSYHPLVGRCISKQAYTDLMAGKERTGGCGVETRMGRELSETYARDPKFYGGTFCCGCGTHHPVAEFFWAGSGNEVGS